MMQKVMKVTVRFPASWMTGSIILAFDILPNRKKTGQTASLGMGHI
jgi:hypothetical protein